MNENTLMEIAAQLDQARLQGTTVPPLSSTHPGLQVEQAYRIQQLQTERRLAAGGREVGKKIGLTSRAVQTMLGVDQPDFGALFEDMQVPDGATVQWGQLIQPKIEGEIAFRLGQDLDRPDITPQDVLDATESVQACFEIVDSRIEQWKIGIADTVADNASSALFVLGQRMVPPADFDFRLCGMVLEKNGDITVTGAGAAALGSPLISVAWLANQLRQFGVPLRRGEVILSGALGAMVPVTRGDRFRLEIAGLGACDVAFS